MTETLSPKFEKIETPIPDCFIIRSKQHKDFRGWFEESLNLRDFKDLGLPTVWPQSNLSWSKPNIIRGLHFQRRQPQGKLVRCLFGAVLDVCVDLRPESPAFGRHFSIILNALEPAALYLPPGAGHGFSVQKGPALVQYNCTTLYDPDSDDGIHHKDAELNIDWRLQHYEISSKDQRLKSFKEYKKRLKEVELCH